MDDGGSRITSVGGRNHTVMKCSIIQSCCFVRSLVRVAVVVVVVVEVLVIVPNGNDDVLGGVTGAVFVVSDVWK